MQNFYNSIGMHNMEILPLVVKLLLSILCGGVLGIDRTKKRRVAGVRTYSMVCLGSAVVMITGIALQQINGGGDPSRLGAQVVSGIGFIGAGAIMVTGYHEIKGLTTAAGLWTAACLGLAIGTGYYTLAIVSCILIYIIMHFGGILQDKYLKKIRRLSVFVSFDTADSITAFMVKAREQDITILDCDYINTPRTSTTTSAVFALKIPNDMEHEDTIKSFEDVNGILFMERIL